MKIRNLLTVGLMAVGIVTSAQAQTYYSAPPVRGNLARRVEIDRRVVARDRVDLRYANRFNEGREVRDLRAAQERLNCDRRELRAARGYRPYAGRY